jgi:hypothetical protein
MTRLANLLFSLPVSAALLCAAPAASAQTSLVANIPFAFTANHVQLPAGRYQVELKSDCFLDLHNIQTGKSVFAMVRPERGSVVVNRGKLIFQRTGNHIYMTQVWTTGTDRHSDLTGRPKYNQELAMQIEPVSTIEIAAR